MSFAHTWGTTAAEREAAWPCDAWPEGEADACYRGVDVAASPAICFRWLCQLKTAPYSYDWIDNFGRRSPQTLTSGLEVLTLGERFMVFFELRSFTPDREITLGTVAGSRLFGRIGVTYRVVPGAGGGATATRLLAKLRLQRRPGPMGWLMARFLPWGDLVMMRRQLLNLKRLAEGSATGGG